MITVITCAYNTAKFTELCARSVDDQRNVRQHIVFIDGCEPTLKSWEPFKAENRKLYFSPENHGRSICQNTLINLVDDKKIILLWDSDDVMPEGFLDDLPEPKANELYHMSAKRTMIIDGHFITLNESPLLCDNCMLMKAGTYKLLGGYETKYRMACDSDFCRRYDTHF